MKYIARIQQRKRQTWLALPTSGIEEVGYGNVTERSLGQSCQDTPGSSRGRVEAQGGTRLALADLMEWTGITKQDEEMTLMIHHLHAMGSAKSQPPLNPTRHVFEPSEKVAREFRNQCLLAIQKDPDNAIIEPE